MGTHPPIVHTVSGRAVDLLDPSPDSIDLEDIATGLAHICRFAGQCRQFYSVAQHSLLCSELAKGHEAWGLMHDASEAYLGDVPRPVKHQIDDYRLMEDRLQAAIAERFGLPAYPGHIIGPLDLALLRTEWQTLMLGKCPVPGKPADIAIRPVGPEQARETFLSAARSMGLR